MQEFWQKTPAECRPVRGRKRICCTGWARGCLYSAVPVPSKWTTIYGPLDFCSGWLPKVFCNAFGSLTFAEFQRGEAEAETDCRLIESLAYSAVSGRRFQSSLSFLEDACSRWMVSPVVSCKTRVLWYLLGFWGAGILGVHGAGVKDQGGLGVQSLGVQGVGCRMWDWRGLAFSCGFRV